MNYIDAAILGFIFGTSIFGFYVYSGSVTALLPYSFIVAYYIWRLFA